MSTASAVDISLSGFTRGDLLTLSDRCARILEWSDIAEYAREPWSNDEPVSLVDLLADVSAVGLRIWHSHTLILSRLAAHAAARACREGGEVFTFPEFFEALVDTYDALMKEYLVGNEADASLQDAALSAQKRPASDRVHPDDFGGHRLGEGAPLPKDIGEFVSGDDDLSPDILGHGEHPSSGREDQARPSPSGLEWARDTASAEPRSAA